MYGGNNNNPGGGFGGFGGFADNMGGGGGGGFLGGFFPSPQKAGGGGGFGNSPSHGGMMGKAPSTRDVQGLLAVTIKMVLEAAAHSDEGNTVRFHGGSEASLVELVGQVDSVDESEQMFARYVIDDGTGKIVCKKFVEADSAASREARVPAGSFVRVIGPFRRFGSESYINAHKVEKVKNLDDIARHRIEVVHTMLQVGGQLDEAPSGAVSAVSASMSSVTAPSELYRESMW